MQSKTSAVFVTPQMAGDKAALADCVRKMSRAYHRDGTVPPRLVAEAARYRAAIEKEKGKVMV